MSGTCLPKYYQEIDWNLVETVDDLKLSAKRAEMTLKNKEEKKDFLKRKFAQLRVSGTHATGSSTTNNNNNVYKLIGSFYIEYDDFNSTNNKIKHKRSNTLKGKYKYEERRQTVEHKEEGQHTVKQEQKAEQNILTIESIMDEFLEVTNPEINIERYKGEECRLNTIEGKFIQAKSLSIKTSQSKLSEETIEKLKRKTTLMILYHNGTT